MTKLRDLERHLRANGCERLRATTRAICRQLEVPDVE